MKLAILEVVAAPPTTAVPTPGTPFLSDWENAKFGIR